MSDKELLLHQLTNPPVMSMALNKDHLYRMMADSMKEAADRIEALTAELATCEKYRDAYAECDSIGTQAVRDLEAKLAECEARLSKAVEALRYYAVEAMPWEADDSLIARSTLAEIESNSNKKTG